MVSGGWTFFSLRTDRKINVHGGWFLKNIFILPGKGIVYEKICYLNSY